MKSSDIINIHDDIIKNYGGLPGIKSRGSLASCIGKMDLIINGKEIYSTKADKVGILCYLLTMNHVFNDGNKRTAFASSVYYIDDDNINFSGLVDLILEASKGNKTKSKEEFIKYFKELLGENEMKNLNEYKISKDNFKVELDEIKERLEKELGSRLIAFETIKFRKIRSGDMWGSRFYINNVESNKSLRFNWTPDMELHSIDIWLTKDTRPNYTVNAVGEELEDIVQAVKKLLEGQITNIVKLAEDESTEESDVLVSDEYNRFEKIRRKVLNYLKNVVDVEGGAVVKRKRISSNEFKITYEWDTVLTNGIKASLTKGIKEEDIIFLDIQGYRNKDLTYKLPEEWMAARDKLAYINKL